MSTRFEDLLGSSDPSVVAKAWRTATDAERHYVNVGAMADALDTLSKAWREHELRDA